MADPIIVNPLGVNAPQGNEFYVDAVYARYAVDPYGNYNTITGITGANPAVVTTTNNHGLVSGQQVTFNSVVTTVAGTQTLLNGPQTYPVTVISATTFSVPVNTTGGTMTVVGAYCTAGYVPGQLVYLPNPGGTIAAPTWTTTQGTVTTTYPIAKLAPITTANANVLGVVVGSNSIGQTALPGGVVLVQQTGLALVSCATSGITAGQTLLSGGANPGEPKSVASGTAGNQGLGIGTVQTSVSTGTAVTRVQGWVLLKSS